MKDSLLSKDVFWWGNHAALSHGAYSPWPSMRCRLANRHGISGAPPPAKGRRYVLRFTSHASRPLATHPAKEKDCCKNTTPAIRYGSLKQPNTEAGVMDAFLNKYRDKTTGIISVFDRIIFKGYLPISYPQAAESFLSRRGFLVKDFRAFTRNQTEYLRAYAQKIAEKAKRPYEYQRDKRRKEDYVRDMAERDGITEGLICVIARNEENHSYGLRYGEGRPCLVKNSPQCLTLYFYCMDRHFGLMHIRLSTWMPFNIQVYINGHEWLARQMTNKSMRFKQVENAFTLIEDCPRAQRIADKLPTLPWENILHVFARRVNPLLKTILSGMEYYWVIDQAEYATDVMCGSTAWLDELYIKWQKHAAVCFQANDIMRFMGRKLHGSFDGSITTDVKVRPSVTRVKHGVRGNWIKMYNKNGIVLRVETVINRPGEFRVFRLGRGRKAGYYQPMRKRVANMYHYARLSLRANRAYLDALAPVDDPCAAYHAIERVCEPVRRNNNPARPMNPLRKNDRILFEAVMRGEHHIHGFKSQDIGVRLGIIYSANPLERRRQSSYVYRKIRLLRCHGLITRYGRSRRYRLTEWGATFMNAAISLHADTLPSLFAKAA